MGMALRHKAVKARFKLAHVKPVVMLAVEKVF